MPIRLPAALVAAAVFAPCVVQAQVSGFVSRLGADTVVIERFTMAGGQGEGAILRRSPRATMMRYTVTMNPDGSVAAYSQVTTRADGSPLPTGSVPLKMTFTGDSVVREIQANGATLVLRSAVPRGTLPAIGGSSILAQAMIQMTKGGGTPYTIGFGAQASAVKADVRMITPDSAEIVNGGFRTGYRIEQDGRITRGDGSLTTQKFIVSRYTGVNIDSIAAVWAAKDAAGESMGAASTRDTLRASVGTATVTLDYGRPARRGREIWGKLVPFDTTWRFGANAAAQLRTDKAIVVGGTTIEPGAYTVWLYPSEKSQSLLIVNRQTGQWGTAYDAQQDVARIPITKQAVRATAEERFTVTVERNQLLMTWDRGGYVVSIREK
jgi:Protein of unknown function (DUF2911)